MPITVENLDVDKNPKLPELEPENFGYELYPEQKRVLYLMHSLEQQPSILSHYQLVEFNKMRLATVFSFGKTIVVLALVALKKQPIRRNYYGELIDYHIKHMIVKRSKYIHTSLVLVGQGVYVQWKNHIEKTDLSVLYVRTKIDFIQLCVFIINHDTYPVLDKYDMVLLVYKKFGDDDCIPHGMHKQCTPTSLNIVSTLSTSHVWDRFIVDDFDTIKIGRDLHVPARMSWLISTTLHDHMMDINTMFSLASLNNRVMSVCKSHHIYNLSIRSSSSATLPKINYYKYSFRDNYYVNRLVNTLSYSDDVRERLNSGDIAGAAQAMGISVECHSMGDIMNKVIYKHRANLKNALEVYDRFDKVYKQRSEQPILEGGEELSFNHYYGKISVGQTKCLDDIPNTEEVVKSLKAMRSQAQMYVTRCSNIMTRIRENIAEGECTKCCLDIDDGNSYVTSCCNVTICEDCVVSRKTKRIIDRCPHCSLFIGRGSLIQINGNIDIESMDVTPTKPPLKLTALVNILKEKHVEGYEALETKRRFALNLIESDKTVVKPASLPNKYLIFCRFGSSMELIADQLREHNIKFVTIRGGCTQIANAVSAYKGDVDVMLMITNAVVAGLNLENTTHMIFYHAINNREIYSQLVGRAQRIGRKSSLELIELHNIGETN